MACLTILPFDSRNENDRKELQCVKVTSIENLLDLLLSSPGNPDKPLRLIRDENGSMLIVKFCDSSSSRKSSIDDELNNLKCLLHSKHVKILDNHVALSEWSGITRGGSAVCTRYIRPLSNLHTIRQVAKHGDDYLWRDVLFQTIFTIFTLQVEFQGFRHNDLKGDNVLVTTASPYTSYTYAIDARNQSNLTKSLRLRRTWKLNPSAIAKIIDFELACTPKGEKITSRAILDINSDQSANFRKDFGLTPQRCDLFDIHLLLYDALTVATGFLEKELRKFALFFFDKKLLSDQHLTGQCRLKVEDQIELQKTHGNFALLNMLSHPYFYHMRGDALEDCQNTIEI